MVLRVLFAEDNYLVRAGTAALLAENEDVGVVATVADAPSLLRAVAADPPDVVLTDIRMPPTHTTEGIEAARRIRADHPSIGVVVLSQFVEHAYAYELLRDGVAGLGYLLKERVAEVDELVRALLVVARGGSVLDPKVVEGLIAHTARAARGPLANLTEREHQVLREMATGKNNAAIARTLFLSERAIEKNINSLFHKLGLSEEEDVHRRVRAVLAFLEAGGA
jgi:DNA-binding NarL/FixJ family response regulator